MRTRRVFGIVLASILLGGCPQTKAVFDARACPREKTYTAEQQAQVAKDLDQTPPSVQEFVVDYGKLRDQARACRGERPRKAVVVTAPRAR